MSGVDDLVALLEAAARPEPEPGQAYLRFIEDPDGGCLVELTAADGSLHYGFDGGRS